MGRQQTLGQSVNPPTSLRLANSLSFAGKFFTMPKSTKTAPPQQASLQEIWGKKKAPKPVASETKPNIKSDAMDVDTHEDSKGWTLFMKRESLAYHLSTSS